MTFPDALLTRARAVTLVSFVVLFAGYAQAAPRTP